MLADLIAIYTIFFIAAGIAIWRRRCDARQKDDETHL
jgi:hypothetical protein